MTSITEGALGGSSLNAGVATSSGTEELVSSTQFLELLVAQIENQNPLEPLDGTEWATQLAEFANLEQLTQVNEGLDTINLGQAGILNQQAIEMLGKDVIFPGNEVVRAENQTVDLTYNLNAGAPDLTISVFDENGLLVGTIDRAPRAAGLNTFEWDGTVRTGDGEQTLPPGTYRFEVSAFDDSSAIGVQTYGSGRVSGVTYENGFPELMLGDKRVVPRQVLRVVTD